MFWWKSKTSSNDSKQNSSQALVRQDPRIKVETTTAQSETTNSSVKNATIFNSNTNTVTFQTTRQTVTHTKQARITEINSRRTPTLEELDEMLRTMNMNKGESAYRKSGNFAGTSAQRRSGNFSNNVNSGISAKSVVKFKSSADTTTSPVKRLIFTYDASKANTSTNRNSADLTPQTPKTPTLVKIQEVSFSQNSGCTVTSKTETQRIKIKTKNISKPSTTTYSTRTDARPLLALPDPTTLSANTTYTSPYLNRALYTPPQPNKNSNYTSAYASTGYSSLFNRPVVSTTTTTTTATKPSYTSIFNLPKTTTSTTRATTTEPTALIASLKPTKPIISAKTGKKSNLKPGCVYIFNNERFDDPKNETRVGSFEDVKMLCKTFEQFKLKVTVTENATLQKLRNIITKIETKDFTQHSSIVIVIMSHGTRYEEIAAKDGNYSIDDDLLFPILRNRTLIEKPKLFFIQACKGAMEAGGFKRDASMPHGTPSEILKCYSTFEGIFLSN